MQRIARAGASPAPTIHSLCRRFVVYSRGDPCGPHAFSHINYSIAFHANQCLCVVAHARPTEPGCIRIRKLPMGKRMHNTRVPSVLCLSTCGMQVAALTQEALLHQSQMK